MSGSSERWAHAVYGPFVTNIRLLVMALIGVGLAVQVVPYGRGHENPEVIREPAWSGPRTRELFFRACGDCHSNQTAWPWYGSVAPASWLVQRDVDEGRSHFNVSEWGRAKNHGDDAAEMVRMREMPPFFYLRAHPKAQLTDADREALIAGLVATFGEKESEHAPHAHDHR